MVVGVVTDPVASQVPVVVPGVGHAIDLDQLIRLVVQLGIRAGHGLLRLAYAAHPERFVKGLPEPPALPDAVWINPPQTGEKARSDTRTLDTEFAEPVSKTH